MLTNRPFIGVMLLGLLCTLAQSGATEIEIINPSAEINGGVDGTAISDPSVLGWEAVDGTIQAGGIDYGNGAWRLNYEDGGAVFQMTPHAIATGESFSLRFDAASFTAFGTDVFTSNLTVIGGSILNGDFNAGSITNDSESFALTPAWTNIGTGNQNIQATRTNKNVDGTRNAVLYNNPNKVFGIDTGHTLSSGEVFQTSYVWRDASNWEDNNDRIRITLFTTADDQIFGPRTDIESMDSELSTVNDTYESQTGQFSAIPPSADGKRLFVAVDTVSTNVNGYVRLDNFTLIRGDLINLSPPAMIADFYVDNGGSRQAVFTQTMDFKSGTAGDWQHCHVAVTNGTLDAYAGKTVGIQFRGADDASTRYQAVDNVRLDVWAAGPSGGAFSNHWNSTPDQVWPGPGYWGNRLHDWEVATNRVNATGAAGSRDRRTLHRVGTTIRGNGENFHLTVRTGLNTGAWSSGSRTGFLIGSGFNLDWRAALLVHDGWGRDFGLFCGMRGNGKAAIEDYSTASTTALGSLGATPGLVPDPARIEFDAVYNAPDYDLTVSVYTNGGVTPVSQATATVSSDRILGSFGLLSHKGSKKSTFWFDDFAGTGEALQPEPNRQLAIVGAMHTLSRGTLKLTAQMMPFDLATTPNVYLDTWDGSNWQQAATALIDTNAISAYNATFRMAGWDDTVDTPYRVRLPLGGETFTWEGTVRKDPVDKNELVICGLTGQRIASGNVQSGTRDWTPVHVWHPHAKPVGHIAKFHPDVIAATGDQIYEGQPTPADNSSSSARHYDYLYKWYMWLLQWREQGRTTPMIVIPDDHDVYQGNLWGEGGVISTNQNEGGYVRPAEWVRMLERTMTDNLPDPDPYNAVQPAPPIEQGIKVYFTGMVYGRVGIAVIEDRKFKTGPTNPPAENEQVLLGQRQHDFLDAWAKDWAGQELKFMVSQSPLGNLHTHASSGYSFSINDKDTHGWPVHRRNEAWEHIRKSFMFQLAGDQHLSTVAWHGVAEPHDAGYSFAVPALANFFPRCWDPVHNAKGTTPVISPYKGDFYLDGNGTLPDGITPNLTSTFPHHFDMIAAGNPKQYYQQTRGIDPSALHDRGAGYGIVRIDKSTRKITFECWPRFADPEYPQTGSQYPDWPVIFSQFDNYGRVPMGYLTPVDTGSSDNPVICVTDETTGETVYGLRIRGNRFQPPVFDTNTTYRIDIYEGDATSPSNTLTGQTVAATDSHAIDLFDAQEQRIMLGDSARLRWQVRGSETVSIDQGVGDVTLLDAHGNGYCEVSPTNDTVYTLTSDDGAGGILQLSVTVRVFPDRPTWREDHFTPAELGNPALEATLWGDEADPDGDGIKNWLEHLLGGDPRVKSTAILPFSEFADQPDGKQYAMHEYSELLPTGEAAYEFQAGNDLFGWSTIVPPDVEEVSRIVGGAGVPDRVTARQLPSIDDETRPRRFYRLRIIDLR